MARKSKLWELMSPEDKKKEYEWAVQLYESRVWFCEHVRHALMYRKNPTARRAIYEDWRRKYGDDRARGPAKYVEACVQGKAEWLDLQKMIANGPPKAEDYV